MIEARALQETKEKMAGNYHGSSSGCKEILPWAAGSFIQGNDQCSHRKILYPTVSAAGIIATSGEKKGRLPSICP